MKHESLIRCGKVFAVLPTALTLGNAVCGFGAITFASKWANYDATTSLFVASCLIYLGMVFDAFDATRGPAGRTGPASSARNSTHSATPSPSAPRPRF